ERILAVLSDELGELLVPAPTTAEVDYLLGQRFGLDARRGFLTDLARGRFTVASLERIDYETIVELDKKYADLNLGLADCALVALAARYETTRILSFDERHFRAVTPLSGGAFTILPADG
ncbi:MAG TPA: PIN domain-containing protein, partial [Solirubrobacteraceae bacterium]